MRAGLVLCLNTAQVRVGVVALEVYSIAALFRKPFERNTKKKKTNAFCLDFGNGFRTAVAVNRSLQYHRNRDNNINSKNYYYFYLPYFFFFNSLTFLTMMNALL